MDMSSVSSIGGGAAAFFPFAGPSTYAASTYNTYNPSPSTAFDSEDLLAQCQSTAARIRERYEYEQQYGAVDEPYLFQRGKSRRGALFCRSGTWLEILDEPPENSVERETIRGSISQNTKYGVLDFISVAIGLISIRGVESGRYLCMNSEGTLYSTPFSNYSSECVFMEEMMENYYNLYSSCTYGTRKRPWYVAIRRTGIPRDGKKTRKRLKASHFLVVHYDTPAEPAEDPITLAKVLIPSLKHQPLTKRRYKKPITKPPRMPSRATLEHRRKMKKRRREERLKKEEEQRSLRKEEIRLLRVHEQYHKKTREYDEEYRQRQLQRQLNQASPSPTPRLSGAGLQIRPRRQ